MSNGKTIEEYNQQIRAEVANISQELSWPSIELDDKKILDSLGKIKQLLVDASQDLLDEPVQTFLDNLDKIRFAIQQNIEKRTEKLLALQRAKASINEEFMAKMKDDLASEKTHLSKLHAICSTFDQKIQEQYFQELLTNYNQAVLDFESQKNDFEYRHFFSKEVVELENQLKQSFNTLSEEQRNQLIATLESMAQVISYRRSIFPSENNPLIRRATILLNTIIDCFGQYRAELLGHALNWLKTSHNTVADLSMFSKDYKTKFIFYSRVQEKLRSFSAFLNFEFQENEPMANTLSVFLAQQADPLLSYQGHLNLIALEKWELINQIFADCENYTYTARLWTTPTGINELKGLKKRWNQLGNQQLANLDYYFARVKKIINTRLEENSENNDQKRTHETHSFYKECQSNIAQLQEKQKTNWTIVIREAVALGAYSDAQTALIKMRLPEDEKVKNWVNLVAAIFEKVSSEEVSDQERSKHIFDALRAAKSELLGFSVADQIRFYDELLEKVNAQKTYDATQIKKILVLARSFEDAHDPKRYDHVWFGLATGVSEIVNEMPSPVNFICELSAKNNSTEENKETVWQWVDKLIQQLVGIVSSRLELTKKQSTRHEETQKFYVHTNNACAINLPGSAKMYKDEAQKTVGEKSSGEVNHEIELGRSSLQQAVY